MAVVLIAGIILSRVLDSVPADLEPDISISADQARDHVGKAAEVCGEVASASYLQAETGRPTFLNFGSPYPSQVFTAVIFGDNRNLFRGPPEEIYLQRSICVIGNIRLHNGVPQIVVSGPGQITR